jgi:hypothetical protein
MKRHAEPTFEAIRAAVLHVQHRVEAREGAATAARPQARGEVEVPVPVVAENGPAPARPRVGVTRDRPGR